MAFVSHRVVGKLQESSSLGLTCGSKLSVMYIWNMGGCKGSTVGLHNYLSNHLFREHCYTS